MLLLKNKIIFYIFVLMAFGFAREVLAAGSCITVDVGDLKDCQPVNVPEDCDTICDFERLPAGACTYIETTCEEWGGAQLPQNNNVEESEGIFKQLSPQVESLNKLSLTGRSGAQTLIGRVIKTGMGVIGSIALIMFVFGGFMWMTARGNAEQVSRSLRILSWAALGIIVILSSYVLVDFLFQAF